MPGVRPTEEEALTLLKKLGCDDSLLRHCRAVAEVAAEIAAQCLKRGAKVDVGIVKIGALLHDMGRIRTHGIEHGVVGGSIARGLGLDPTIVSIIERHVLAGISREEAEEFGLPPRDYIPRTLEEKIVAYADKLINGSRRLPIERFIGSVARWLGPNHSIVKRLEKLRGEFPGF